MRALRRFVHAVASLALAEPDVLACFDGGFTAARCCPGEAATDEAAAGVQRVLELFKQTGVASEGEVSTATSHSQAKPSHTTHHLPSPSLPSPRPSFVLQRTRSRSARGVGCSS